MLKLTDDTIKKIRNIEVLLIGCSAGGFSVVYDLLLQIPGNMPVAIIVVIHRSRKHQSSIESLLNSRSKMHVKLAEDKEEVKKGTAYFAPSDYHLLLEPNGTFALDSSDPVLYSRPSIDVTFESVSDVYQEKTMAILLSGANEDGANGIAYIAKNNGLTVIQDPQSAEVPTMPEAAIRKSKNSLILPNLEIFELVKNIPMIKTRSHE